MELQLQQRQRELEQPQQLEQQPGVRGAFAFAKMMASLFTFEHLHRAWLDCRRRKRGKPAALAFEANAEEEILALARELVERIYRPRPSFCFVARNDKYREVFAAQFRDRVVHHLLVRQLEMIWEPVFIHDSYASRRGKGTHAAVQRLQSFMRRATANGTRRAWFAQLDIRSFFPSIDRDLMLGMLLSRLEDEELRWLARVIVLHDPTEDPIAACSPERWRKIAPGKSLFSVPPGKGLPIGNLTSQFFANVYLNPLDQFVKHTLKAKYYIRYVDDMILVHEDPDVLKMWRDSIEVFVRERLLLELHPSRRIIRPVSNGADFVGYVVRPSHLLVRRRTVDRCKAALGQYAKRVISEDTGSTSLTFPPGVYENLHGTLQSYFGLFRHASSRRLCDSVFASRPWLDLLIDRYDASLRKRWAFPGNPGDLKSQYAYFRRRFRGVIIFQVGCYYEVYDRDAFYAMRTCGFKRIPARHRFYARCGFHLARRDLFLKRLAAGGIDVMLVMQTGLPNGLVMERIAAFLNVKHLSSAMPAIE